MPNTNPQAIRIANERFRVFADRAAKLYHFSRALEAQIEAQGIESFFMDGDDAVIADGSDIDGRSPLTNDDIKHLIDHVTEIVQYLDGRTEMRDLLLRVAVNPGF